MASRREEVIRVLHNILVPLIRADGGQVYLVRADEGAIELHLSGRYAGSPGLTLTTRRVVEPAVLAVMPSARVVVTSGALVPEGAKPLGEDPKPQ
jgi:Fe-S cluster biogenesis protein NfuA